MKELKYKVTGNRQIAAGTYEMILEGMSDGCSDIIKNPGQFINIKLDGFFLRRPISVCDWDGNRITIIYKTVGRGTEAMSGYEEGRILDILVPLGNGFDISVSGDAPVLIGGGAGVPPMYGLCKSLLAAGRHPSVVMGFNTSDEVFYIEEFRKLGVDPVVTTADGSVGIKGFVTDALKYMDFTYIYTCGPEPMLRAIDRTADESVRGQMSFEERMGCGFGACMGCSCKTKYGNKRICKEGPVLERGEIIWEK